MHSSALEWPEEVKKGYTYDPEGAAKLLDEAGYPRGADGEGALLQRACTVSPQRLHHYLGLGLRWEPTPFVAISLALLVALDTLYHAVRFSRGISDRGRDAKLLPARLTSSSPCATLEPGFERMNRSRYDSTQTWPLDPTQSGLPPAPPPRHTQDNYLFDNQLTSPDDLPVRDPAHAVSYHRQYKEILKEPHARAA